MPHQVLTTKDLKELGGFSLSFHSNSYKIGRHLNVVSVPKTLYTRAKWLYTHKCRTRIQLYRNAKRVSNALDVSFSFKLSSGEVVSLTISVQEHQGYIHPPGLLYRIFSAESATGNSRAVAN